MSDYYRELKSCMNKLSEFNIWDSLFVIRQYILKAFPNYNIAKAQFANIESPNYCIIPVYFIDFLTVATLRYSSTLRSDKSIRQIKYRLPLMRKFDDVYNRSNKENFGVIFIWLKSYMLSQYKMQHYAFFADRIYKYYYLFSSQQLSQCVKTELKIPIDQYIKLVMMLYYAFSRKFDYSRNELYKFVADGTHFSEQELKIVLGLLCKDIYQVKEEVKVDFSNTLFLTHNDSIHVSSPIIHDKGKFYCTIPTYILNAGIDGLQYKLELKKQHKSSLNHELSSRFEDYVGLQLKFYCRKEHPFNFIKEVIYKKGQNKTSDWIIYDNDCIIFADCKLKKLTINSISQTSLNRSIVDNVVNSGLFSTREKIKELISLQESDLMKDIIEIGIDLGKILCCYVDWKNGIIPGLPAFNPNIRFKALLITLEETFGGMGELNEIINRIAYAYVKAKKGIDLSGIDMGIISSSTFDKSIPIIAAIGIKQHVFEEQFEYNDKTKLIHNEYLSQCFDSFIR